MGAGAASGHGLTIAWTTAIAAVPAAAWRALEPDDVPFQDHAFLAALERSGALGRESGWLLHVALCKRGETIVGAMPMYLRTNSYGEYIFDWAWARAYREHGVPYYPKLVAAVPFTPATAPKILVRPGEERAPIAAALLAALDELYEEAAVSSAHLLFITATEADELRARGWLVRHTSQYHWRNAGYRTFADFLGALTGKRRRQIERERRQVQESGLRV
jgi:predicted N-acyltransferase